MKIRWKDTPIIGAFHNDPNGIKTGQVVDLDDFHAKRYVKHEMAELVDDADTAAHF